MGRPVKDRLNHRYGKLLVVARAESANRQARWKCLCDCGVSVIKAGGHLLKGSSCGCSLHVKHGHATGKFSRTYTSWDSMKARCTRPSHPNYLNYGGRGITFDSSWGEFTSFLLDMGERPEGHTLDRIDNDMGYGPMNCRWATPKQQQANRRVCK